MNRRAITTRTWEAGPHDWHDCQAEGYCGTTSKHFWYEVYDDHWLETGDLTETPKASWVDEETGIRSGYVMAATRYLHQSNDTLEFVT